MEANTSNTVQNGAAVVAIANSSTVKPVITKSALMGNAEKGLYVFNEEYQKEGTLTLELRQGINSTSVYPSARVGSNLSDSLFGSEEFGFAAQEFTSTEQRVAWIEVPATLTFEEAMARIASAPNACLYKYLSNRPILDENQLYAISAGLTTKTMDDYANQQVVRYSADHAQAGQIILDRHGKPQYRRVLFSGKGSEDIDDRNADMANTYTTPEITAELAGVQGVATVVTGQTL